MIRYVIVASSVFFAFFIGSCVLNRGFTGGSQDLEYSILSKRCVRDQLRQSAIWAPELHIRKWGQRIAGARNLCQGLVGLMDFDTLDLCVKNSGCRNVFRKSVKFAALTGGIAMQYWTRENVRRFLEGDFVVEGGYTRLLEGELVVEYGYPVFPGSEVENPKRKSELDLLRIQYLNRILDEEPVNHDRLFEIQFLSRVEVYELIRWNPTGQGFFCLGPQGTMSELCENGSIALVRIPGLEYFCSDVLHGNWQHAAVNGMGLSFPEGISIVLKVTVQLRLPPGMKEDVLDVLGKKLKARTLDYMLGSFSKHAVSYRGFKTSVTASSIEGCLDIELRCEAVEKDGLGSELDPKGGLLARCMADALKDEIKSCGNIRVRMVIHCVDAWYSLDGDLFGPATYIVRGFYNQLKDPKVFFLLSKAHATLDEHPLLGLEAITVSRLNESDSFFWYHAGALAIGL